MDKKMIVIQNSDGTSVEVELVTYLISDDKKRNYLVFSKGEKIGAEEDEVIYISKVVRDNSIVSISEITSNEEWNEVLSLLKNIANA